MSPQACDEFRGELSAYLDGELSGDERRQVHRHLRDCPSCAADLAALRDVARELASLPRAKAPRDLSGDVQREFVRRALSPAGRPVAWMNALRVTASAALIVLAVTVTWRVLRPITDEGAVPLSQSPATEERGFASGAAGAAPADEDENGFASRSLTRAESKEATISSLERESALGKLIGGNANAPTVDLVIVPQTMREFNDAIDILSSFGVPTGDLAKAEQPRLRAGLHEKLAGAGERQIELQVDSEQVWALIDALQANASQQVAVAMKFNGSDSSLLQAGLGGGRGRFAAGELSDEDEVDAEAVEEEMVNADRLAGRRRLGVDESRPSAPAAESARARKLTQDKDADVRFKKQVSAEGRTVAPQRSRGRRGPTTDLKKAGVSEAADPDGAPATQRGFGGGKPLSERSKSVRLGLASGRDLRNRPASISRQSNKAVTFRVRVAAPPAAAATQPTSTLPSKP